MASALEWARVDPPEGRLHVPACQAADGALDMAPVGAGGAGYAATDEAGAAPAPGKFRHHSGTGILKAPLASGMVITLHAIADIYSARGAAAEGSL